MVYLFQYLLIFYLTYYEKLKKKSKKSLIIKCHMFLYLQLKPLSSLLVVIYGLSILFNYVQGRTVSLLNPGLKPLWDLPNNSKYSAFLQYPDRQGVLATYKTSW